MADVWSIRGVPENTRERAKRAAQHSGMSVGELVTQSINRTLNQRREDDIQYVLQQLTARMETLANEQTAIARDVNALYEQFAGARRAAMQSGIARQQEMRAQDAHDRKDVTTLHDVVAAYGRLYERLEDELRERRESRIDRNAG